MPKATIITRKVFGGAYDVNGLEKSICARRRQPRLADRAHRGATARGVLEIIFRADIAHPAEDRRSRTAQYEARGASLCAAVQQAPCAASTDEVIMPHSTRPACSVVHPG